MKVQYLLTTILGLLDLGVHGAPPKPAVAAPASGGGSPPGGPPDFPDPEVVKLKTHVLPWKEKGMYGEVSSIKEVSDALEKCRVAVTKITPNPLNPSAGIFANRKFLTDSAKDATGCAAFLLWFFKTMPKGAHLHIHFNAILPFLDAWNLAFNDPNKFPDPYYQYEAPPGFTEPILVVGPKAKMVDTKRAKGKDPKGKDYPFGPMPQKKAEELKPIFGAQQLFPPNVKDPWAHFNGKGTPSWKYPFMDYEFLKRYTSKVIQVGLQNGIYYQEWRTTFLSPSIVEHEKYLQVIYDVVAAEKATNKRFLGASIIYCVTREFDRVAVPPFLGVTWQVDNLITLLGKNKKWKELIVGFDIVGEEERVKVGGQAGSFFPNSRYEDDLDKLVKFVETDAKSGKYPFGLPLHTGETRSATGKGKANIDFIIKYRKQLQAQKSKVQMRIGHGIFLTLPGQAKLLETTSKLNLGNEICFNSNKAFGYLKNSLDVKKRILPIFEKSSASINGDDPTMQGTDPTDEILSLFLGGLTLDHMIAANEMASSQAIITQALRKTLVTQSRTEWKNMWGAAKTNFPTLVK